MSYTSKQGGGSRNSDEDGRPPVSVKVGTRLLMSVGVCRPRNADSVSPKLCESVHRCDRQIPASIPSLSASRDLWFTTRPQQA